MSHFRLPLGTLEIDDGSGGFDDWLQRILAYLSLNDPRHKIVAEHFIENIDRSLTREELTPIYDKHSGRALDEKVRLHGVCGV